MAFCPWPFRHGRIACSTRAVTGNRGEGAGSRSAQGRKEIWRSFMSTGDFSARFEELTGRRPLSWQRRVYQEWTSTGHISPVIDLPTGMGKTMVMAIWLIAREDHPDIVPTRLIYVVDRRTVVDQATDIAQELRCRFGKEKLAISTLRGQLADNREWSADPSRPAIVIGTVDLIGSALLFSGYRSSSRRRSLEAGLLGQDSLLVLDEAHLSRPFEKLITSISAFQEPHGKPMCVVRMSATSAERCSGNERPFTLQCDYEGNLTGEDARDSTIAERFGAPKRLTVNDVVDAKKANDAVVRAAIELAGDRTAVGKRIVVFVRRPEDARSIANAIRKHGGSKTTSGPHAESVEVLTGTMRGLERDGLVEKAVFKERWLNGDLKPSNPVNQFPVFLVATSAGEVGFDLNGDHLVCDAAPLDSMIQRLGRINRRGKGDSVVLLVKHDAPAKTDFERACVAASSLFTDGTDLSPKALAALKKRLTPEEVDGASSPAPATVDVTDILLDAWSMTSIAEPMPGRPPVGPWLRGVDNDQAQTTVAWRAELDLFGDDSASEKTLAAIFSKHPIRPHESLTVNTGFLLDFLKRIPKLKGRRPDLMSNRVAVRLPRGQVFCPTLEGLVRAPGLLYADSTLILPASFDGLDEAGMLDAESILKLQHDEDPEPRSRDVADRTGYERSDEARARLRIVIARSDDGSWTPKPLPGLLIPEDIGLDVRYETSGALFSDLKAANLRVRLVQPIVYDDDGDAVRSLVVLAPAPKRKEKENQFLTEHVAAVEAEANRIAGTLRLAEDDLARAALLFAAKWHDEGKKARVWQVFANNPDTDAPPLGKMAQARDPKSLRGYRHELGSLLRNPVPGPLRHGRLRSACRPRGARTRFALDRHTSWLGPASLRVCCLRPVHGPRTRRRPHRGDSPLRTTAAQGRLVALGLAGEPAAVRGPAR